MTYRELLLQGENILKNSNISDFKTDAFYLLEEVFNISRSTYILNSEESIEDKNDKIEEYYEKLKLRKNHIPLQYITHNQEFMGLPFYVDENVLIPRQDTEILVEKAIAVIKSIDESKENKKGEAINETLKTDASEKIRVLDMCTGSGCIAVSVAKLCRNTVVTGVDLSKKALEIATINAKENNVNIIFKESDLFSSLQGEMFDIIISNPPYIRTDDIGKLMEEVRLHEPFMALDGSEDGLKFYRAITKEAVKHLSCGGYLIYEIGFDQSCEVRAIMKDIGFDDIEIIKDLAGHSRVVCGRMTYGGNKNV